MNMQQHSDCIEDVKCFVMKSKLRLQKILQRLDWSEEGVLQNFNSNSVVNSNLPNPKNICPPTVTTYPESLVATNSLTTDTLELQRLLKNDQIEAPRNFRELQANFSREQKLQIYEHVISNTVTLDNNTVPKVADGEISLAEIVAQKKREEKRKKRKFRKSKPTHIEEVRSLVDLQMQALLQFIGNQKEQKLEQKRTKDRCNSERKRSRSRDNHRRSRVIKYTSQQRTDESRKRSKSRSKERFIESRKRSRNRSNERTIKKRSRSKTFEPRKRDQSRETTRDHNNKYNFKEESESYQRKDHGNYHRRQSTSPQATFSGVNHHSNEIYHGSSSRHSRNIYDNDYDDERKKHKQDSNRRGEIKSRDKEKYYAKQDRVDKHKEREHNSSYRHRSKEKKIDHGSKHKRKH